MILPPEAHPLVQVLALHFTGPTYQRFSTLLVGAIVTTGRRTIANVFRTLRQLAPGHPTDYRRVLSRAPWSGLPFGCALVRFLLGPRRSRRPRARWSATTPWTGTPASTCTARPAIATPSARPTPTPPWRYGHKWVVLAVLVKFPFATRPWALPVLIDLYRIARRLDLAESRPHKTPAQLLCRLLRLLLIRFPDRAFVSAGDSGYGTHEVARFCYRHRDRLTLVSKLHPDANLFDPPPPYTGKGDRAPRANAGTKPRRGRRGGHRPSVRWRSVGTAAARGASRPWRDGALVQGRSRNSCRSGGCSSATTAARTATSTSSPPT